MKLFAVFSPKPRPATHSGRPGGNQHWAREPYHLRRSSDATRTRCGRDCSEWMIMGEIDEVGDDCCVRCLSITDPAKQ